MNEVAFPSGPLADRVNKALAAASDEDVLERMWRKDASLWKSDPDSERVINNSLGWLTVADEMIGVAEERLNPAVSPSRQNPQLSWGNPPRYGHN